MHFITYAKKLATYRIEILLSIGITISAILLFYVARDKAPIVKSESSNVIEKNDERRDGEKKNIKDRKIFVEISGAVYKPGVYEMTGGSRLHELLEMAEGLSKQADKGFFFRNYNQARLLEDGEKIHAPSLEEVAKGSFIEQPLIIYTNKIGVSDSLLLSPQQSSDTSKSKLISINNDTVSELESLPSVGKVTAEKIVSSRPYVTIEELRSKEVVSESLFTKIQPLITL